MPSQRLLKNCCVLLLAVALLGPLCFAAYAQPPKATPAALPVPSIETIPRTDRARRATFEEQQSKTFIRKTEAHPVQGDRYVILTDHNEEAFLRPLERLAKHHAGTMLHVEDLGGLPKKLSAREELTARLRELHPRFVAIAPRLENYRENVLLSMWEVLSTLDPDPQLDVFPAWLVAPNQRAFEALIEHSIHYQPQGQEKLRPLVMGQVVDASVTGLRSLQKVGIIRNLFSQCGYTTASLVTRTYQARLAGGNDPSPPQQWEVAMAAPRQFITQLPPPAKQALDEASLLLMFGHGAPGMTCSLDVGVFHDVRMENKVVLCGSCFSAYPLHSDFPPMPSGPDGSAIRNERERFAMRALENGAVVVYAHMRLNGGFPDLFPVLEGWMNGLTVGEAYQRLLNAVIDVNGFAPGDFVLRDEDADRQPAVMRRNALLLVVIGDPALQPMVSIGHRPGGP